jgi:hypothetical protein
MVLPMTELYKMRFFFSLFYVLKMNKNLQRQVLLDVHILKIYDTPMIVYS